MSLVTESNAGERLDGSAMPDLIAMFAAKCRGRRIVEVGYTIEDGEAWPILILDNDEAIIAERDDEGNGPGVLRTRGAIPCQTRAKGGAR